MTDTDSPRRGVARCPTCHGSVAVMDDGSLFDHQRYADGAGPYPNQPHNLILCEGESEL